MDVEGPKGRLNAVRVIAPHRPKTQVEIARTDAFALGLKPPVAGSGKLEGAGRRTLALVSALVEAGVLVVASGGGGVPVVEQADGRYEGGEAVIDKDLAAVVLARSVEADGLLLLSDVDAVYRRWGTPRQEAILRLSVEEAMAGLAAGAWPAGSMAPKVRACAQFVQGGGRFAAIGALENAVAIVKGASGTWFGTDAGGLPRRAA